MKKLLIFLSIIFVVGVTGVSAAIYATSGLTQSAQVFFEAVKTKDYPSAYQLVSNGFKGTTSNDQFVSFLETSGIGDVKDTSWNNRKVSLGTGALEGTVTTKGGATVPVRITFVKEDGAWRVHSIDKDPAGVSDDTGPAPPTSQETMQLAQETIKVFAQSVTAKDFTSFHKYIAPVWQNQATVPQLNEVFSTFIEQEIDLVPVTSLQPVFDKRPTISDGVLVLEGHYPGETLKVNFRLKYIKDGVSWKTVGTSVDAKVVASNSNATEDAEGDPEDETE